MFKYIPSWVTQLKAVTVMYATCSESIQPPAALHSSAEGWSGKTADQVFFFLGGNGAIVSTQIREIAFRSDDL